MYEFKVNKSSNDIEDICITYGLSFILYTNDIEYKIVDKSSMYVIYTDNFDFEDIVFEMPDSGNLWNYNSNFSMSEKQKKINMINRYLDVNMINILKYYIGEDVEFNKVQIYNDKKQKMEVESCDYSSLGSVYYSLGIRGGNKPISLKGNGNEHRIYLSAIGWYYGASYFKCGDTEVNMILKPITTNEVKKPYNFTMVSKETGDVIPLTSLKSKNSYIHSMAIATVETLINHKLITEEYSDIIFIKYIKSGNKPLGDKTYKMEIPRFTQEFLNDMLKTLTWSNVDRDIKEMTSKYILNPNKYGEFSNMIRTYSKQKKNNNKPKVEVKINIKFKEEILNMLENSVSKIYNMQSVMTLGTGLKRLMRDDKGYEIQSRLYSVNNSFKLQESVRSILDTYYRYYKKNLLNNEQLLSLIVEIETNRECKICADAILSYSKVFIIKKEEN